MPKKIKIPSTERRFTGNIEADVRLKKEDGKPTKIVGYFAKFNKTSRNLGGFVEIIEPGFFREALKDSDVLDLFNHDDNYVLGRESSKTLKVWEDKVGLRYELIAPETQLIKDLVLAPIERKDIKGNSFGFRTASNGDRWEETEDGKTIRYLVADGCKELIDGSQVTRPAYDDTGLALRSMAAWKKDNDNDDEGSNNRNQENNKNSVDYGNHNDFLDLADLTNKLGQATDENRSKFIEQINDMLSTFKTESSKDTATGEEDDDDTNDGNSSVRSTKLLKMKLKLQERSL